MSSYLASSHWVVALPNDMGSSKATVDKLRISMVENTGKTLADFYPFDVPTLKVGSLDTLMTLNDEVVRADTFVEGILKKVERQVAESYVAEKTLDIQRHGGEVQPGSIEPLRMYVPSREGRPVPVNDWVANFKWDASWGGAHDNLPDVLKRLVTAAEKVDSDLRAFIQSYNDKKNALQVVERKKSGNLMVAALEDIITPELLDEKRAEWIDDSSEYLTSLVVVIQKAQVESFEAGYFTIDGHAVPVGPAHARESVHSSPVVPGSLVRLAEDNDGYVLYTLVVLKKFADSFKAACREKRITIRDFQLIPERAGSIGRQLSTLGHELALSLAALKTESRRKYGEIMHIWFHVKAIRVFVQSVLRFGLPINFSATLVKVHRGANPQQTAEIASKLLDSLRKGANGILGLINPFESNTGDSKQKTADPVIPGISDDVSSQQPFVFLDFDIKTDTGSIIAK